jgi:hypothetical protein
VLLGLLAVVVSGCGVLEALSADRLAGRATIIAACLQRWDPDADATRDAQAAADRARELAATVDEALATQVRMMRAVRLARPYAEDAAALAPGVAARWVEFADRAARTRAFRTDQVVAPDGLFALAEEAIASIEAALDAYHRIEGDRLAVAVLGTWARGERGSEPWIRDVLRSARGPEEVAAAAFAHPAVDEAPALGGAVDRVRGRIERRDDSGVIAALEELGERSQPAFVLADDETPWLGQSVGRLARDAAAALATLEDAELSWLQRATEAQEGLTRQLRRAEQAAQAANPACLPTGPLVPGPAASPGRTSAAPGS